VRVAILNYRFFPLIDGPSIQAKLLGEKLSDNGVEVFVVTRRFSAKHPEFENVNGINVQRLSCFGGYFWGHFPYGAKCFTTLMKYRKRIDIVNTNGSIGMAIIGIACARFLNKRIISTFNTCGLKIVGKVSSMKIPILGRLLRMMLKRMDAAVAISSKIYEDLRSVQFPEAKIYIIPCGLNTHSFSPVSKEKKRLLREQLKLPEKTLVVFTGRLVDSKGVDILLEALREILKSTTDIHLLIVGEGYPPLLSVEEELRKYVEDHNLSDYVTFTGSVRNVHEYLQASDIFAFPSRIEGLGVSLLEAMSCCMPVVATSAGGIPDAVQDGEDGLLIPVDDHKELAKKILLIKNDVNLAEKLGRNARQKVMREFSIEAVAQEYAGLYRGNVPPKEGCKLEKLGAVLPDGGKGCP